VVRAAVGAARPRLVRQLLTESAVLGILSALSGAWLARLGMLGLIALAPENLPRLDEVRVDLTALAFAIGISLVASLPDRDLLVRGQHGAYVQVLLNLLTNARQSLESGRHEGRGIALRLEPAAAGLVRLVVSNNGPAIPAELAERVFEPFFTTRPQGEGSGLGLALCRQILTRYGGTIVLEPTVADEGPSFRIELPQA